MVDGQHPLEVSECGTLCTVSLGVSAVSPPEDASRVVTQAQPIHEHGKIGARRVSSWQRDVEAVYQPRHGLQVMFCPADDRPFGSLDRLAERLGQALSLMTSFIRFCTIPSVSVGTSSPSNSPLTCHSWSASRRDPTASVLDSIRLPVGRARSRDISGLSARPRSGLLDTDSLDVSAGGGTKSLNK